MDDLAELLDRQSGLVSRTQLVDRGFADNDIRRWVRRREFVAVHTGVYVTHTGPLNWLERSWAAVLALWPAALSHDSALRTADGPGRRNFDESAPIHVAVARERTVRAPAGVRVHYLTSYDERVRQDAHPPRVRIEEAVLDVAAGTKDEMALIATLADAVQSRRTTAARIADAVSERKRLPHRVLILDVLDDLARGTCSVLEQRYLRDVEQAHGLPDASRQLRASSRGPIYRDVVYEEFGQVVELDGRAFHDNATARDNDLERDLDAAVDGLDTVRLGWGQVTERACSTAAKVGALLQKRGWDGALVRCPQCPILQSPGD